MTTNILGYAVPSTKADLKSVAGSIFGGSFETQELLDFCGEHRIIPEMENIKIQEVNEAYERMLKSDVKYRFVIDMTSLKA